MGTGKPGKPIQADWLYDNRASLRGAGDALRSYLSAVEELAEGTSQKGIELPAAKQRLFMRSVREFHQCLRRLSEQSFLKGDETFAEVLRELDTMLSATERKLGLSDAEASRDPEPAPSRMKTGRQSPVYITVGRAKTKIFYDERPR